MTTVISLPDGATAQFRDADQLSNRDVKTLRRAARRVGIVGDKLKDLGLEEVRDAEDQDSDETNRKALKILSNLTDDEDDALDLFQRTCVVVRLIDWSLDLPKPTTVEDVDLLPRRIYSVLTTEASKLDLSDDFEMSPETLNNPKADSEESDSSAPL